MASSREHDLAHLVADAERAHGEQRRRLLHEIQERMHGHFRAEEGADGWFERAVRAMPEVADRLDALRDEHLSLAATAISLVGDHDADQEEAFLAALRRHEEEEADLLARLLHFRAG